MEAPALRLIHTPTALADWRASLEWEPGPSARRVTWAEATASATDRGWRLPSASELVGFLSSIPKDAFWLPPVGTTFWSATSSPFARGNQVRGVARDADGRFVVVLMSRFERAVCWAVRRPLPTERAAALS